MRFQFSTANQIFFGPGIVKQIAPLAVERGSRPLVLTGGSPERVSTLMDALTAEGMKITPYAVTAEPTVNTALAAVRSARRAECDLVIGIGGGSVIDTGKVVAALITS
jgi:alcohol dehydrogenase class IV